MELDLEPHRPERGDLVRHARLDQARGAFRIEDALGRRVEHAVEQPALQHTDQPQVPGAVRCERSSPGGTVASVNTGVLR